MSRLSAALVLFVALSAACAGGGAGPTKAEYVGAANQMCNGVRADLIKEADLHALTKPDEGANQRYVRFKVIKKLRMLTGGLRTIAPPEGDAGYLGSMISDYEYALRIWYSDPLGDLSTQSLVAAERRFTAYGLSACNGLATLQKPAEAAALPAAPTAANGPS